jgi:hypothetical protein
MTRGGESQPDATDSTPSTWTGTTWSSYESGTDQRYEVSATVVQGTGVAVLCLGAIASPSICEGSPAPIGKLPITNWNWERVEGEQRDSDVTWGEYHLLGTYDGAFFTVLEAGPSMPSDETQDPIDTPCPEPEGGWVATDPSQTTEADLEAAGSYVQRQPDSAGYWIDYIKNPVGEAVDFASAPYVVIAAFRSDAERHREELAHIWGGPLCLVEYERTGDDLDRIHDELPDPGSHGFGVDVLWSATDVIRNRVEIGVVIFDERAQTEFDRRYGVGAVRQVPSLIPVDDG